MKAMLKTWWAHQNCISEVCTAVEQPTSEFLALKHAFPSTTIYGCDFHREQARAQLTS